MRGKLSLVFSFGLFLFCWVVNSRGQSLAIVGGTLIDGTGAAPVENAAVVIQSGRVTVAGPRQRVSIPEGAKQIDAVGKFILPGLIDGHVHLYGFGIRTPKAVVYGPELVERMGQNARTQLMAGFTTVFDVNGSVHELRQVRDAISAGKTVGARVFIGGPGLRADQGFPAPAPLSPEEALNQKRTVPGEFKGVEGARVKVRELIKLGVDHIKVYQDGPGPGYAGYPPTVRPEELAAIVEEAHKAAIPVTAHTRGPEGVRNGIKAGLNSMQHVVYMGGDIPDETVRLLAQSSVYVFPTIVALTSILEAIEDPASLEEARQRLGLPKEGIEDLFKLVSNPKEYTRENYYRAAYAEVKRGKDNLRRLIKAGIGPRIALGTDAGGPLLNFHGTSYREAVALVEAGMSPMEAIVASTRNPALAYGKKDFGTLEAGKAADVIVVDGNPLEDIRNLKNVVLVFKAGQQFK